jgi:hypothetical protein
LGISRLLSGSEKNIAKMNINLSILFSSAYSWTQWIVRELLSEFETGLNYSFSTDQDHYSSRVHADGAII